MADLNTGDSADTTKIVGANSSAVESGNFLVINADGSINTTAIGSAIVEQHTVDLGADLYTAGTTKGILALSRVVAAAPSLTSGQFSGTTLDTAGNLRIADRDRHAELATITGAQGVGVLGSDGSVFRWLKLDASGNLVIASAPSNNTFFVIGEITSATTTTKKTEKTPYTEQTVDAQRSMVSSSALDTAAGTGARTVKITYLDSTGAGPFTETITLNGVAAVNTVATNICFIEDMEVITVGSTGSNAGIISLKAGLAGAGVTIGTIAALDNQVFWCHHYIPTGKTMRVTGISCSHNGTTVGSGGVFFLRRKFIPAANRPDIQITDFVRLYGQASTFERSYNSPIKVVGPASVLMYVTPETSTSVVYRAALDFFED